MKITFQFVIAIVFAALAAGLNWFYLSLKTTPRISTYVVATDDIKQGNRIEASQIGGFKFVQMESDETTISESSLIPYNNREILFNLAAPRSYKKGDFILLQDLNQPNTPAYESLGPFRLLSVGDQLTGQITEDSSSGQILTLAVKKDYDEKTRTLIQILQKQQEAELEDSAIRILGVEVPKPTKNPQEGVVQKLDLQADEVAIFVDISDLDSVPKILSAGDQIGFIIPKVSNAAAE